MAMRPRHLSDPFVFCLLALWGCPADDPVNSTPDASPTGSSTTTSSTGTSTTSSTTASGPTGSGGSTQTSGTAGSTSTSTSGTAGTTGGSGGATGGSGGSGMGGTGGGSIIDASPPFANFCDLPGSVRFTSGGTVIVSGGVGASNVTFLRMPAGFCAHWFGNVGNARQLRFAPNGDLFVASPTKGTTSGGQNGKNAIVIFTDQDKDGASDGPPTTFLGSIVATQGILFANNYFYYQDDWKILRVPYKSGDRMPSGPSEQVADFHSTGTTGYYTSSLHWTKSMDQADDGTIFVANGSDQDEQCDVARPFRGGIVKLDGTIAGKPISKGFRNPTAVRCSRGHNLCFAAELSKDYSAAVGGREKLVPIREGDDWGFPCCATKDLAYSDIPQRPDCSKIVPDDVSFFIGDTPFGFDFERGRWNGPYSGAVFVALHGAAGSWAGERVIVVATDPGTGLPKPGSNVPGTSSGAMADFATGWEDGSRAHGRPTSIEFAADGRMFVGNDTNGDIFWIAPLDLPR
jgi:glucose/arabinose dehydrogenase